MIKNNFFSRYLAEIILAGILVLSGFLNLWNIWNQGFSVEYYAAAVKSMLANPKVIFFNSYDAAGFVTVDKPPLGLWVQVAGARLLGFSNWSLALPQALAGVCSVWLLYLLVSRSFGKPAGLVSAYTLAITPIFVAISRSLTQEGLLITVLLLAVFAALKAAEKQSLPYLLLSVALVGIGFNIKMIQAFVALPAILAVYLLGAKIPPRQKAVHLIIAFLILALISLSWAVAVGMVPADERPYIGNSGDNTVFGLMFDYNGMTRLMGGGITEQNDGSGTGLNLGSSLRLSGPGPDPSAPGEFQPNKSQEHLPVWKRAYAMVTTAILHLMPGRPSAGVVGENGNPGALRLFNQDLAGQLSWLIPFALVGLCAWWRRPATFSYKGLSDAGLSGKRGLTLLVMVLWLAPGLLYFSFSSGFWHPYYLATVAPPLAALVGTGAAAMYQSYVRMEKNWWLLVAAVFITGIAETWILLYDAAWSGILIPVILVGSLAAAGALAWMRVRKHSGTRKFESAVAIIAIALLFIAPSVWACTPLMHTESNRLPLAGPRRGPGTGMPGSGNAVQNSDETGKLAAYLTSHSSGETYLVAVPSSIRQGAALILKTGKPVMALGGFSGRDRILSVNKLQSLVLNNTVRFFLVPRISNNRGMAPTGNDEIFSWVKERCSVVPSSRWSRNWSQLSNQYRLYDCAGAA